MPIESKGDESVLWRAKALVALQKRVKLFLGGSDGIRPCKGNDATNSVGANAGSRKSFFPGGKVVDDF